MYSLRNTIADVAGSWLALTLCQGVNAQSAVTPPVLSATINEGQSAQVFAGWPVLLQVSLIHPDLLHSNAVPITLKADVGHWATLIRILIQDKNGAAVSWPLTLLNSPANALVLDSDRLGELQWSLSPAQTAVLPAGNYTLSVTLDSSGQTNVATWKGAAPSGPLQAQLAPEPAPLTPTQLEQKQRLLAKYHFCLGNPAEALRQVNVLLQSDSNNIGGLSLKGAILRGLGAYREASTAVNQALTRVGVVYPDASEPPRELLRHQFELAQLLRPGRINSIGVTGQTIGLEWNTEAGDTYKLEGSLDLTNWTVLAAGLVAQTNTLQWSTNRVLSREFFRIAP